MIDTLKMWAVGLPYAVWCWWRARQHLYVEQQIMAELRQAAQRMRESPMIKEWAIMKLSKAAGVDLETARKMWSDARP